MGKPSPRQQPQPTPPPAPAPTPPPEPVKPKVEPQEVEQVSVDPKAAVGAAGGAYKGTGRASRTTLTGARGLAGSTPVRRPMLTGSMGTAYKTTLGG